MKERLFTGKKQKIATTIAGIGILASSYGAVKHVEALEVPQEDTSATHQLRKDLSHEVFIPQVSRDGPLPTPTPTPEPTPTSESIIIENPYGIGEAIEYGTSWYGDPYDDVTWDRLADCESGEWDENGMPIFGTARWDLVDGSPFYGGVQFTLSSWEWVGGEGNPADASREEQIYRAKLLWELQGWNAWPACSVKLGYQ